MKNFILSPSALNTYINDPALFVLRAFYKLYGDSNIYAIRGILVEHAVNMRLANKGKSSFEQFALSALTKVFTQGVEFSMEDLKSYYDWGMKCYKELPVGYIQQRQNKVEGVIEGVKMAGYTDYKCQIKAIISSGESFEYYIDLKTVSKETTLVSRGVRKGLVKSDKRDNVRQQIIYRILTGKPQELYFITSGGQCLRYQIGYRDYREHLPLIKEKLQEIKKLLTMSLQDVIIKIQPDEKKMNNPYSFGWSDELRAEAVKIWNI